MLNGTDSPKFHSNNNQVGSVYPYNTVATLIWRVTLHYVYVTVIKNIVSPAAP